MKSIKLSGDFSKNVQLDIPLNRNYKIQDLLNNNNKNILINQREDNPLILILAISEFSLVFPEVSNFELLNRKVYTPCDSWSWLTKSSSYQQIAVPYDLLF